MDVVVVGFFFYIASRWFEYTLSLGSLSELSIVDILVPIRRGRRSLSLPVRGGKDFTLPLVTLPRGGCFFCHFGPSSPPPHQYAVFACPWLTLWVLGHLLISLF